MAKGKIIACVHQWQSRRADNMQFFIMIILVAECEYENFVSRFFKIAFVQINVIRNAADMRLVNVGHHGDAHEYMVQGRRRSVKAPMVE